MKNKVKFFITFILTSLLFNYVTGQETNFASNISKYLSLDNKKLVTKYDLVFQDTSQLFDVVLKIFYDDKIIQPQENTLTGSWGTSLKPGTDYVILWEFPDELKGDINKMTVEVIAIKTIGPLANFEYEVLSNQPPYQVKFNNKSKNADYSYWKFGDVKSGINNLSDLRNPVHKYRAGGTYNVELKAGNMTSKTEDNIVKEVSFGMGNEQEIQNHKKLKTIWLGSTIATAGIGGFCILRYSSLEDKFRKSGDSKFRSESKTYRTIGIAALVASGACISQVFIQSKKIRTYEKGMSMNLLPFNKGCALELAVNF